MTEQASRSISRRTLTKGAAWAVPALPIVAAAPAMAASQPPIEITSVSRSCKHSGLGNNDYPKGYHIEFIFRNTSLDPVTFTLPGLVSLDDSAGSSQTNCVPGGSADPTPGQVLTVTVPANTAAYYVVVHYYSNTSANVTITFDYSYVGGVGVSGTEEFTSALSGDVCDSTPIGISDQHLCTTAAGGADGTATDPVCIPMPAGACPPVP